MSRLSLVTKALIAVAILAVAAPALAKPKIINVPEFDAGMAGAAVALVIGGALLVARKRKS